jgi:VWFA-related protein
MMKPDLHARPIQKLTTGDRFSLREMKEAVRSESARLYVCSILAVLLGAVASVGVLAAQESAKKNTTDDSSFVLRQTVRRVRVDVVVTDGQGHLVPGLHASDFRIAEDGKTQSVRQFEYHSDEVADAPLPKRPQLPPHTFMNLPTSPEHGPLTVLLYDILNTPMDDQYFAREQMIKFLKKNPGRRIAIFVLGSRLHFLQGFTSDTDLIERAINDAATTPQRSDISYVDPLVTENVERLEGTKTDNRDTNAAVDRVILAEQALVAREEITRLDLRVEMTLDALKQIGRFLAGTPGRKNLIWYTGSFPADISLANNGIQRTETGVVITPVPGTNILVNQPGNHQYEGVRNYNDRIKDATNRLNSAEIAVYPIDARSLATNVTSSASNGTVTGFTGVSKYFFDHAAEFATMNLIGEQTGGHAFYNNNGLEQALDKASAEGSSYYSLVYAPNNAKYDGSVRRISVHVGQEHYHLAYRRSYISDDDASVAHKQSLADQSAGSPDQAPVASDSLEEAAQLVEPPSHQLIFAAHVDAVGVPAPATAEQMTALEPYREQAAKNDGKKFVQPKTPVSMQQYAIAYSVLASQLDLPKSVNGAYHSDLSMAALAFDEDGETLCGTKTRIKDEIPVSKIDNIRKEGFQAIQLFFVPVGTAVIRLAVRDEHSEHIGSMEIRLPLPPDQRQGVGAQ